MSLHVNQIFNILQELNVQFFYMGRVQVTCHNLPVVPARNITMKFVFSDHVHIHANLTCSTTVTLAFLRLFPSTRAPDIEDGPGSSLSPRNCNLLA